MIKKPYEHQVVITKLNTTYAISKLLAMIPQDYIRISLKDMAFGINPGANAGLGQAVVVINGLTSGFADGDYRNALRCVSFAATANNLLAINSNLLGGGKTHADLVVHRSEIEQLGFQLSVNILVNGIAATVVNPFLTLVFQGLD